MLTDADRASITPALIRRRNVECGMRMAHSAMSRQVKDKPVAGTLCCTQKHGPACGTNASHLGASKEASRKRRHKRQQRSHQQHKHHPRFKRLQLQQVHQASKWQLQQLQQR